MRQQLYQMEMYLQGLSNQDMLSQENQKKNLELSTLKTLAEPAGTCSPSIKIGHWTEKEQAKYYAFLERFKEKFNEKETRRQWKVFKMMSQFIKTRDPNQCRSHHHKMTKNFNSIQETLQFLKKKNPSLAIKSSKYGDKLTKINEKSQKDELFPQIINNNVNEIVLRNQQNKQVDKYDTYFDKSKLNDIGNLKTDVTCNILSEQPVFDFSGAAFAPSQSSFKGFPTTGLLSSSITPMSQFTSNYPQYSNFQYQSYIMNYTYFDNIPHLTQNEQKWKECHQCYIKWILKLQSLVQ